jgi:hypothetical protein
MKILNFSGETYQAERIVKTDANIIGYNGNAEVFSFKGISDFSLFQLAEGQEWDIDEKAAESAYLLDLDFRISMIELGV